MKKTTSLVIAISFSFISCQSSDDLASSLNRQSTITSPIPTASPSGLSGVLDSEEQAFVVLINHYRTQNGVPVLQVSPVLVTSSRWLSNDMAQGNYLSHTDTLGRDPFQRMSSFGYSQYTTAGENIAAGYADALDTFTQWQNSPAHNANMLNASYLWLGVARAYSASSTYGWYWTTDFGSNDE